MRQKIKVRSRATGAAKTVYLGEGKQAGRWFTLWTTARLDRINAKEALKSHPSYEEFTEARVTKFERA